MTFNRLLKSLPLFLLLFCSAQIVNGQVKTGLKTNEIFLRESIRELLQQTFTDFPGGRPELIFIHSESDNPASWLVEQELTSYLTSRDFEVALPQPELKSEISGNFWNLGYRIIELRLEYPKVKSKGLFGRKSVIRQSNLNLSFRLMEKDTGRILWTKTKGQTKTDQIPKKTIPAVENEQYAFLSPRLPESTISKYVEPALVAAVVGGLVYLFFASR